MISLFLDTECMAPLVSNLNVEKKLPFPQQLSLQSCRVLNSGERESKKTDMLHDIPVMGEEKKLAD